MKKNQLDKNEAIKLITPVIDGETTEDQSRAFFRYIKQDQEVNRCFKAEKKIKDLVSKRLPRIPAPSHLRKRIQWVLTRCKKSSREPIDSLLGG